MLRKSFLSSMIVFSLLIGGSVSAFDIKNFIGQKVLNKEVLATFASLTGAYEYGKKLYNGFNKSKKLQSVQNNKKNIAFFVLCATSSVISGAAAYKKLRL